VKERRREGDERGEGTCMLYREGDMAKNMSNYIPGSSYKN
jgi:hypothetical protein